MKEYITKIQTKSPLHLGHGKESVLIDAVMAQDERGLPYFPARRFKGLLYESALEMAEISGERWFTKQDIDVVFGRSDSQSACFTLDNLYLPSYDTEWQEWDYLQHTYPGIFNAATVLDSYCELRYQTAIDKESGTAKEGSLRNMQVLEPGITFYGKLIIHEQEALVEKILAKAFPNLRFAGANRNRGFGHISCSYAMPQKGR